MALGTKSRNALFENDTSERDLRAAAAELAKDAAHNDVAKQLLEALEADFPELRDDQQADQAKAAQLLHTL